LVSQSIDAFGQHPLRIKNEQNGKRKNREKLTGLSGPSQEKPERKRKNHELFLGQKSQSIEETRRRGEQQQVASKAFKRTGNEKPSQPMSSFL